MENASNPMKYFVCIAIISCLTLGLGCTNRVLSPLPKDLSSEDYERRIFLDAKQEQQLLQRSGIIYRDRDLEAYFNHVAERLRCPDICKDITFKIRIIKDPYLNAFAFPDGAIFLHTGILAQLDNEAQLAALLAHEMAHCTQRHALRLYERLRNRGVFLRQAPARFFQAGDPLTGFNAMDSPTVISEYVQDLETEADMVGLTLMSKAGYELKEMPRLARHLEGEARTQGSREPRAFGTHGMREKCISDQIKLLGKAGRINGNGIRNRARFLDKTKEVVLFNGSLDLNAGRYDLALKAVNKYVGISGGDTGSYFLLGEIYRKKDETGDREKAKTFYRMAISMNPAYSDPHRAIGMMYYKEGNWTLAMRSFEACLALAPGLEDRAYIEGYLEKCHQMEYGS